MQNNQVQNLGESPTFIRLPVYNNPDQHDDDIMLETVPRMAALRMMEPHQLTSEMFANDIEIQKESVAGKAVGNFVLQTAGKLYGYVASLLSLTLLIRLLVPNMYGNYAIVSFYIYFFGALADGGVIFIAVREAAKFPNKLDSILGIAFLLKILFSGIAYGLAAALVIFMPYTMYVKIGIVFTAITLFVSSVLGVYDVLFQVRLQPRIPTIAETVYKNILFVGTIVIFILRVHYSVEQLTLFYYFVGISGLANIVIGFIKYFSGSKSLKMNLNFERKYAQTIFLTSLSVGVVGILAQIHSKVDSFILSLLQSPTNVGIYNLAYKVVDILFLLFGVYTTVMFPIISRRFFEGQRSFEQTITRVLNVCLSLSVPITIGTIVLAPQIIGILGGGKYPKSILPLQLLSVALIFIFMNMIYTYIVIAANQQKNLIWIEIINITVNVLINLYVIPIYSYNGSALATDITECLGMLLVISIVNRWYRAMPSFSILFKIIVAASVMGIAIYFINFEFLLHYTQYVTLPILIILGSGVYGAILLLLGGFDPALIRIATNQLARFGIRIGATR